MKRFAVAYMNLLDNDLKLEVVEAVDWWEARAKAFPETDGCLSGDLDDDIEGAREEAYTQDWLFDVIEIPEIIVTGDPE